jgi:hypothetical protein
MNACAGRRASLVQRIIGLSGFLFRCGFHMEIGRKPMVPRSLPVVVGALFTIKLVQCNK